MNHDVKQLCERGDKLFTERSGLLSLWQTIAENFYPERADFTAHRHLGDEFADHLTTSYPVMVRRDLGNSFAAMLRPRSTPWFRVSISGGTQDLSHEAKSWLEFATERQRQFMYDRHSCFTRAAKEGDHDFATFGQAAITTEINWHAKVPHLLYRCWHLRDVAWTEAYDGKVREVYRRWNPMLQDLAREIGTKNLHHKLLQELEKQPHRRVSCYEIVVPTEMYGGEQRWTQEFVRLRIDRENHHVMSEAGRETTGYTIPRWQTVSGSQYAYSPATIVGLADARTIQAMSLTLLEAGEMAVRPPMLATQEAIRSDVQLYAGGITWTDKDYDERLGDVLRPLSQDLRGLPFGMDMLQDQRSLLHEVFYISKLSLPPTDHTMTATEVMQRVEQYIRQASPLFEPMEEEYNGKLCEETFQHLLNAGALGPIAEIPDELRGRDIEFEFESPLHDAIERRKGDQFLQAKELLAQAAELEPSVVATLDAGKALREALEGIGVAQDWLRDEQAVEQLMDQQAKMQQLERAVAMAQQAGEAGEAIANAETTAAEGPAGPAV